MPEQASVQAQTIEIVVFDDGTAAVSYFDRSEFGQLSYLGRVFLTREELADWRYKPWVTPRA